MLALILVVRIAGGRAVRHRARRQRADRHRAGVPGQAHARPARGAQRPDRACRARRRTWPRSRSSEVVLDDSSSCAPATRCRPTASCASSDGLEVDESLLTGESDPIAEAAGDEVLSGSIVVAGSGRVPGDRGRRRRVRPQARRRGPPVHASRAPSWSTGSTRSCKYVTWVIVVVGPLLFLAPVPGPERCRTRSPARSPASCAWCPRASCC